MLRKTVIYSIIKMDRFTNGNGKLGNCVVHRYTVWIIDVKTRYLYLDLR